MNAILKPILAAVAVACAGQAAAQVTFYEHKAFRGRAFTADRQVNNFERYGFNDTASSLVVERGRWEVCEERRFEGRCVIVRRGSYDSLESLGLQNSITSVRPMNPNRDYSEAPEPQEQPNYAWRQRPNERVFEAPVTSSRAVLGAPEQRCWTEVRAGERPELNTAGGVIGGVLGGILGHQVGKGSGRTAATIAGAVGGGAVGANVDRLRDRESGREIRRCENVANAQPQYYDVTYTFRGVEHRVQTATPPGRTISVNREGQPRG